MQLDPATHAIDDNNRRYDLSELEAMRDMLERGQPDQQPTPPRISTVADLVDVLQRGNPFLAAAIMYYRAAILESKLVEFAITLERQCGGEPPDSSIAMSIVGGALRSGMYDLYRRNGEVPFTQESPEWRAILDRTGGSPNRMAPLNDNGVHGFNFETTNRSAAEPDAELIAKWRARTTPPMVSDHMRGRSTNGLDFVG